MIESQGVAIDRHSHRALYRDEELPLTPTEFRLLEVLLRQAGRAFTRYELMDAAIGEDAIVLERTIDVHIKSLRKKLGDAADLIETVRGVGYRFHEPRLVGVLSRAAGQRAVRHVRGARACPRPPARSGTSSARTTATSRGASIPSRTWPPSRRTTVTQMSSPMKSFSISFRVSTSMVTLPLCSPGDRFQPGTGSIPAGSRSRPPAAMPLLSTLGHVSAPSPLRPSGASRPATGRSRVRAARDPRCAGGVGH